MLIRLHSECFTGDLLGSLRCDCGVQLRGAIAEIAKQGSGVLLYLAQEGRGIGLVNKLRAYELQDDGFDTIDANEQLGFDADERIYAPAATMLARMGIKRVRLMTNNPQKISQLERYGIEVAERVAHSFPANGHNENYLRTKAERAGSPALRVATMRVGVPKEIKDHEDRVGLVPSSVAELVHHGHEVLVERGAGVGAGLGDDQYIAAGARIVADAEEVFATSEMIVKVKEPLAAERKRLRRGQVLFTYLHLAPDREQTQDLLEERRHGDRLRDRHLALRHAAAADADVGDRRPPRAAGRRALSRAHRGRPRRAAGRRAGRAAGRGRGAGRRRVGHACRDHRARHGRHGVRGRPLGRGAAPAGGAVRPACAPSSRPAMRWCTSCAAPTS